MYQSSMSPSTAYISFTIDDVIISVDIDVDTSAIIIRRNIIYERFNSTTICEGLESKKNTVKHHI